MEHAAWSELEEGPDDGRGDTKYSILICMSLMWTKL